MPQRAAMTTGVHRRAAPRAPTGERSDEKDRFDRDNSQSAEGDEKRFSMWDLGLMLSLVSRCRMVSYDIEFGRESICAFLR